MHAKCRKIFDVPLPLDGLLSYLHERVHIDIFRLVELLKRKHPEEDWDHTAFKTLVIKLYGEDAFEWIYKLV
jgi:hypothetical protein